MARTDHDRTLEALAYLHKISPVLSNDVFVSMGSRTDAFGRKLSLEGKGVRLLSSGEQHTAVRALALCELTFFSQPYQPDRDIKNMPRAPISDAQIDETKRQFLRRSTIEIRSEINEYILDANPTLDGLADAAERVSVVTRFDDPLWRVKRSSNRLPGGTAGICYDGVKAWLFAAGMITRKWLANKGILLDANNTHVLFGDGEVVQPSMWDKIPKGYFWSIEKKVGGVVDATTCHWGVSLGGGRSAAVNNTTGSLGSTPGSLVELKCFTKVDNGGPYATFAMTNMCDVANRNMKYSGQSGVHTPQAPDQYIQVRQYNPLSKDARKSMF